MLAVTVGGCSGGRGIRWWDWTRGPRVRRGRGGGRGAAGGLGATLVTLTSGREEGALRVTGSEEGGGAGRRGGPLLLPTVLGGRRGSICMGDEDGPTMTAGGKSGGAEKVGTEATSTVGASRLIL